MFNTDTTTGRTARTSVMSEFSMNSETFMQYAFAATYATQITRADAS